LPALNIILYSCLSATFSTLFLSKAFALNLANNSLIQPKTIKLGTSNALSGPASSLGSDLNEGALTYFKRLNDGGGINGIPVELVSLDDGYEPNVTVLNTKKLIDQEVLALFGYVGTPTSHAIMPMLKKSQIPYLMPFTGADFLRSPINENIFNLRASYYQEGQAQIEYLVNVKKLKKIALVIQADEFGLTAHRAINEIINRKKLSLTLTARYQRNTADLKSALALLSAQPVDAVIFVGTYQPFIRLINLVHQNNPDIVFASLSFIGGHNLVDKIPEASKLILSEVVPDPEKCQWRLCKQFITDMNTAGYEQINRVQFEGYLNAFVFSEVAKKCEDNLNRACLIHEFEQFSYRDNLLDIRFSDSNHQGLQQVYLSFSNALLDKD
jgi:ABC-type branched-subunit amino acid transport system substrate-binding protein